MASDSTTLLDQTGQPIPAPVRARAQRMAASASANAFYRRAYEGAGRDHASTENWDAPTISGASAVASDRRHLSARIHDLIRNDGPTATAVEKKLNSVVGAHWRLSAKPNALRLGLTDDQAQVLSDQIEALWKDYAHESGFWVDVERDCDIDGLLMLAARHVITDGEAFAVLGFRPSPTGFSTCVQIIHPARCSNDKDAPDSHTMRDGVEIDTNGAATAYWFRRAHPGERSFGQLQNLHIWDRFERETAWGRPRTLHVKAKAEAGMKRAVSDFASVLRERKQGHQLTDYELQASMLNAVSALFIETPLDMFDAMDSVSQDVPDVSEVHATNQDYHKHDPIRINGVRAQVGAPGEKFTLTQPNHPNANFEPFMKTVLRSMAARVGITYEQMTGDWSQVNYSSARAAILEVAKGFVVVAGLLKKSFMGPIYRAWLEEAFDLGLITVPVGVPGFVEMPEAWAHAEWVGAGKGYVDPEKEVKAALLRIAGGLSTEEIEAAEQGRDWKEIILQRARERNFRIECGEDPDAAAKASSSGAGRPPQDQTQDQDSLPDRAARRSAVPTIRRSA